MKRIISAGLCTAFILSLAGCARQDTTPSLTAADTTDTQMGRWVESRVDLGGEQLISYPTQLADGTIVLYTGKVGEDSIEDYTRRTSTDGTNWTSEPAAFDVGDAMVTWILVAPDGEQALITYDGENAGLVLQAPDGTKTVVEDDTVKQGINPNTAVFQGDKLDFVSNGDTVDFVQVSLTDGSVTTAALPQDLAYSLNSLTTVGNQLVYLSFDNNTGDIILNALLYRLDMQMEQVIALVEREESFREKCRAIFHFCRTLSEGDASAFRLAMKSIGSVEPDQLFDEGRAYFQRRERDIRRVLLETARQGEREGVISPPADEEYILLTFNSIMQGVYRTICAGISVQGLKLEEDAYRILVKALQ